MEEEEQLLNIEKLIDICRRRFWWIMIPTVLGPLLAIGASYVVRPVYTSQAFVLVEQPKISDKFVTPMITDQLDTRLMTMKEQILSRSRLEPIIQQLNLYKDSKGSMEDKVESLRKAIDVKTIKSDSRAPSGFYITAETDNARTAQQVCNEILSMFMSENLKVRQQHTAGTTQFLADQLAESKRKLDEHDAKLAEFKRRYIGQLPSDEQRNLEMLTSTRARLETVNQELSQTQQQRIVQESTLTQQLASKKSLPSGATRNDLQTQIAAQQSLLASLQARYTDEHPDVIKAKAQLAAMQKQLKGAATQPEPATTKEDPLTESPEVRQARVALRLTEETIRSKRIEQGHLEEQVRTLQGRLQLSPTVEEQYKALTRDYETALQFYNDLLNKKTQSEMASDLERRQEGEQFGVMDAPDLPARPTFPNRIKFALAGLAGGLLLGSGMAYTIERRENFIRTEQDVVQVLGLAVLVGIPEIEPGHIAATASVPFAAKTKTALDAGRHQRARA